MEKDKGSENELIFDINKKNQQLVTVTGATGLLGANVVIKLLNNGYKVRCTKRTTSKPIEALASRNDIEWVVADLMKISELEEAFKGSDGVIHCAAAVYQERYASQDQINANVVGTSNVVEALLKSEKKIRLIHCSSVVTVAIAKSIDKPACEDDYWNMHYHNLDDGYSITKRDAEKLVIDACKNRGLDAVVVNPSYMIGPYDPGSSSSSIILRLVKQEMPGIPSGTMNFVDVRDVAQGMIQALKIGKCGERYILSGHNLKWEQFFQKVSEITKAPAPSLQIPYFLAAALGWWGTLTNDSKLNICRIRWAYCETYYFTCEKAQKELNYTYAPLETAIQDAYQYFKDSKLL